MTTPNQPEEAAMGNTVALKSAKILYRQELHACVPLLNGFRH